MKLDFSQYHPLDHWPYTARCRAHYPHGWRSGWHHLTSTWTYRRRDQALTPLYRLLLCPLGRHKVQVWYARSTVDAGWKVMPRCYYCTYTRLPSESEIDHRAAMPDFRNMET